MPDTELLNVEHAEEVMGRSNAFDHLVLEPEIKDVVKSLSRSYSRWKQSGQRSINTDLIKGKGQGQIFLLHGPPSVTFVEGHDINTNLMSVALERQPPQRQ